MDISTLSALTKRVEQLTRQGEAYPSEKAISEHGDELSKEDTLQLIYTEITTLESKGKAISTESLIERFPTYAVSIERLVAVHRQLAVSGFENIDSRLATPIENDDTFPISGSRDAASFDLKIPERFQIVRLLGSGGMGLVYLAQDQQLQRNVAIKVLRLPDWNEEYRSKLAREGQAVAKLQHQNIVQLFDMGLDCQTPFLCYEWVDGQSLAERLDSGPLDAKDATDLSIQLCDGLAAAHQQSIIHRDIKPANILLTATGTPKITDFGLAKQLGSNDQTQTSGLVGSVAYMSPEQVEGENRDGRIDIYGLGATLYQMLTGQPPLMGSTAMETIRMIQSVEPRPLRELNQLVPKDLETICLKCLEKDPGHRFENVTALRDELKRILDGRPLTIRPVGVWGRSIKWARRNPVVSALLGLLALSILVISVGGYVTAFYQRQMSKELRESNQKAQRKVVEAEAINDFLIESWTSPRPSRDGRQVLVSDRLQAAVEYLLEKPLDSPLTQAELLLTMGKTQARLGYYVDAKKALENAFEINSSMLPPDHSDLLESMIELGDVYTRTGSLEKANELFRAAESSIVASPNGDQKLLITVRNNLAHIHTLKGSFDKASDAFENNLAYCREHLGPFEHKTLMTLSDQIFALHEAGENKLAYEILMQTLPEAEDKLGLNNEAVLNLKSKQASLLQSLGKSEQAVLVYKIVVPAYEEYYGPDHSMTLVQVNNHSVAISDAGNYQEVAKIQCDLVKRFSRVFDSNHSNVIRLNINAGQALLQCGDQSEAQGYLRRAFDNSRSLTKGHSARILASMFWGLYVAKNIEPAKGVSILREAYREIDETESIDPGLKIRLLSVLTMALKAKGEFETALATAKNARTLSHDYYGPDHLESITLENTIARTLSDLRQDDEAIDAFKTLLEKLKRVKGPLHPRTLKAAFSLAMLFRETGNPEQGVRILESTVPKMKKHLGNDWIAESARFELGRAYLESGNVKKSDQTLRQAFARLESMLAGRSKNDAASLSRQINTIMKQLKDTEFESSIDFWNEARQRLKQD